MDIVIAWFVALIVSVAPISRVQYTPDAKETAAEAQARYEAISRDLIEVVYNPNEKPLYTGPMGRANTADVLLAIANFESGFRKDVDQGRGKLAKGDGQGSWCLLQINLGPADAHGKTYQRIIVNPDGSFAFTTDRSKGYGGEDLVSDRKNCFRAGLSIARTSFRCGHTDPKDQLMAYASGHCDGGQRESRLRMGLALRFQAQTPPRSDSDVLSLLASPAPVLAQAEGPVVAFPLIQ